MTDKEREAQIAAMKKYAEAAARSAGKNVRVWTAEGTFGVVGLTEDGAKVRCCVSDCAGWRGNYFVVWASWAGRIALGKVRPYLMA